MSALLELRRTIARDGWENSEQNAIDNYNGSFRLPCISPVSFHRVECPLSQIDGALRLNLPFRIDTLYALSDHSDAILMRSRAHATEQSSPREFWLWEV